MILFDAIIFDLDGTLVATDRFWIQAARIGTRRALAQLGLERAMPSAEEWMDLVGQPLDRGFAALFCDLPEDQRLAIQRACVVEEERLLEGGGAAPMPGALELLDQLELAGLQLGVASNCGGSYLNHMRSLLDLDRRGVHARCLDSPGVATKADMIADILVQLGTSSAVMIGDRHGDRDAAWSNGIPHVHCSFGFARASEDVTAQGCIEDLSQLTRLLGARTTWIQSALAELGFLRKGTAAPRVLGIGGAPLAGSSLLARDAARILSAENVPVRVVEAQHEPPPPWAADGVTIVEGQELLDPARACRVDRLLWIDVPDGELLRRAAGRTRSLGGVGALEDFRTALAAFRRMEKARDPARWADLVLDGANPLGRRSVVTGG